MNRLGRRNGRQQRQDDNNQWKHEARHQRTIDGRPLRGDSNMSAQHSGFRFAGETPPLRRLAGPEHASTELNSRRGGQHLDQAPVPSLSPRRELNTLSHRQQPEARNGDKSPCAF
jgi:hypothetical protein